MENRGRLLGKLLLACCMVVFFSLFTLMIKGMPAIYENISKAGEVKEVNDKQKKVSIGNEDKFTFSVSVVFDVSGSMDRHWADGIKMESAQDATHELLELLEAEHELKERFYQVALVEFETEASVVQQMTSDFDQLHKEVEDLSAGGSTNIGHGLELGYEQLKVRPYDRAYVLLLSDGRTNRGMEPDEIRQWLTETTKSYKAEAVKKMKEDEKEKLDKERLRDFSPQVYTVGFGDPDAIDKELLKDIAEITGGEYFYGDESFDLSNIFVATTHHGTGDVEAEFEGEIEEGEHEKAGSFKLDRRQSELRVALNWPGSHLDLRLLDPDGNVVDEDYQDVKVWRKERPGYVIVEGPSSGEWEVEVYGKDVPEGGTTYYAIASTGDVAAYAGGAMEFLLVVAFTALLALIFVPRLMKNSYLAKIQSCGHCGKSIEIEEQFCSYCGQQQDKKPNKGSGVSKWRIGAIAVLVVFIVLTILNIYYEL